MNADEIQGVEAVWADRLKRNTKLWNGLKFRLHSQQVIDGTFELHLALTDYKSFQGTNMNPALLTRLQERGQAEHGSRRALLAQPLACEVVVETADERIVMVHRSALVGEYANCIDFPGGHPEPANLFLRPSASLAAAAKAMAPASKRDITASLITSLINANPSTIGEALVHEMMECGSQEIAEELNIPSNLLSEVAYITPFLVIRLLASLCPSLQVTLRPLCSSHHFSPCFLVSSTTRRLAASPTLHSTSRLA